MCSAPGVLATAFDLPFSGDSEVASWGTGGRCQRVRRGRCCCRGGGCRPGGSGTRRRRLRRRWDPSWAVSASASLAQPLRTAPVPVDPRLCVLGHPLRLSAGLGRMCRFQRARLRGEAGDAGPARSDRRSSRVMISGIFHPQGSGGAGSLAASARSAAGAWRRGGGAVASGLRRGCGPWARKPQRAAAVQLLAGAGVRQLVLRLPAGSGAPGEPQWVGARRLAGGLSAYSLSLCRFRGGVPCGDTRA